METQWLPDVPFEQSVQYHPSDVLDGDVAQPWSESWFKEGDKYSPWSAPFCFAKRPPRVDRWRQYSIYGV